MTDARQAWRDAGHQISALTARLKEAYELQRAAEARQAGRGSEASGTSAVPDGAAETGSTAGSEPSGGGGAAKAEVQEAVRRLSEAAKDLFEVLGGAAKDPNVQAEVKHVGNSVSTAFAAAFTEIAEQVRKTASKTSERSEPASSGPSGYSASNASSASTGETPPSQSGAADASPPAPYGTPPERPSAED